jgi:hypothetical protein
MHPCLRHARWTLLRKAAAMSLVCLLAACVSRTPAVPERQPLRVVERDLSGSAVAVSERGERNATTTQRP